MAHPVERELIKVTAYKTRTKFNDRQDYLGSILNAVMKLADDDFDNLSDEAADWANAAVHAKNSKEDIPDFDEVGASKDAAEEEPDDATDEDDPEAEDDSGDNAGDPDSDAADDGDDDGGDDSDGDEDESEDDDEGDEEDEGDPTDDNPVDDGDEDEPEDDEPEEAPPAKKPARKPPPKPVKKAAEKAPPKAPVKKRMPHNEDDVILDKWGCMEGSKNSRALAMFEKGATSKEVKAKLGGTYYNILKKMEQDGHTLEKEGAIIKLIHKSEKAKKPGVVKAAKPAAKSASKPAPKKGKK